MNLYFVKLVDRTGCVLAGGHFLAETGFDARQIGMADFQRTAPESMLPFDPSWGCISQRSNASHANALNRA